MQKNILRDIIKKEEIKHIFFMEGRKIADNQFTLDDSLSDLYVIKALFQKVFTDNNIDLSLLSDNLSDFLKSVQKQLCKKDLFVFELQTNINLLFVKS